MRLSRYLIAMCCFGMAQAAPPVVTVSGYVYTATGASGTAIAATGGTITATLAAPCVIGTEYITRGPVVATIGSDGSFSLPLAPTAWCETSGNSYSVRYKPQRGSGVPLQEYTETWTVHASPTSTTIAAVRSATVPSPLAAVSWTQLTGIPTPISSLIATTTANYVFAGPTTGSAAVGSYRALVAADIPSLSTDKLTSGTLANARTTAVSTNTPSTIALRDASGNLSAGTITASLNGNASTADSLAANPTDCAAGQYATAIAASGNLTCAQVSSSQISDQATLARRADALSDFASTTSSQLAGVLSDETGTGAAVFGSSPTIASPTISGTMTLPTGATTWTATGLGLGTTPTRKLDVYHQYTTAGNAYPASVRANIQPVVADNSSYEAFRSQADNSLAPAANSNVAMKAFLGYAYANASNIGSIYGAHGLAHSNSGTNSAAFGLYGESQRTGGALTTGYGVYGVASGAAAKNIGGYFNASGGTLNYALRTGSGTVGLGVDPVISGTGTLHASGNTARVFDATRTPASSSEACNIGEEAFDASYRYTCVATNTWKRVAHATW